MSNQPQITEAQLREMRNSPELRAARQKRVSRILTMAEQLLDREDELSCRAAIEVINANSDSILLVEHKDLWERRERLVTRWNEQAHRLYTEGFLDG